MNVSIPAWVFLGVTMFLLFIMVFVATGSIDDLKMRENYSPQAHEPPKWSKEPEDILLPDGEFPQREDEKKKSPLTAKPIIAPKKYNDNPHFVPLKNKPAYPLSTKKTHELDAIMCNDLINKKTAKCSVFNDQVLKSNVKRVKITNFSPVNITIFINKRAVAQIPGGQIMLLDRSSSHTSIKQGDLVSAVQLQTSTTLFSQQLLEDKFEYNLEIGMAQFNLLKGPQDTNMIVHNHLNVPFEFWYEQNHIGKISANSNTNIEIFRQGFKPGSVIYFRTESHHEYKLTVPVASYNHHFELNIGSASAIVQK